MLETRKAMRRRMLDSTFPWRDVFKGVILDVGSGDDPLDMPVCVHFDLPDGGGDDITQFFPAGTLFDTITGSQVLEHMSDPVVALNSWLKLLRTGGYIVATTPDFARYEKLCFPSKFNDGHKSTWSLDWPGSPAGALHCKLPEWLEQFDKTLIVRCELIDTNFDYTLPRDIDQTFDASKNVEAFCEFVLKKL